MEFNQYIWKLYRESAAAKDAIRRFSTLTPEFAGGDRVLEFEADDVGPDGKKDLYRIDLVDLIRTHASLSSINSAEDAAAFYRSCITGIAVDLPDHPDDFLDSDSTQAIGTIMSAKYRWGSIWPTPSFLSRTCFEEGSTALRTFASSSAFRFRRFQAREARKRMRAITARSIMPCMNSARATISVQRSSVRFFMILPTNVMALTMRATCQSQRRFG